MPIDTAIEVIKKLNELGKKVVYVGIGEKALEHSKELKMAGCNFIDLTNKTTIPELGAVLKHASSLISVDTGTMHMGCAVGTPTVAIFYEQDTIATWGPSSEIYKTVLIDTEHYAENIFNMAIKLITK